MIEFKKTSLWYGEVIALNEVSFKISKGITGLVGTNGAGKTSSIRLAASLLRPTLGEVLVDGEDVWQNYPYLKNLGYSPEIDRQFSFMTGRQFLDTAGKFHQIPLQKRNKRVDEILKRVGMTHAADRKIEGYSRGMRQRIKIGQALVNEPHILLADEPLSGTDPIGRKIMIDLFKELSHDDGVTIIVSSHVLHELERVSDRVIVLDSGQLVAEGKVADVRHALTNIPQKLQVHTSDAVQLGSLIVDLISGIQVNNSENLTVEVDNRQKFAKQLFQKIEGTDIIIYEMSAVGEDLTSVFKMIKKAK